MLHRSTASAALVALLPVFLTTTGSTQDADASHEPTECHGYLQVPIDGAPAEYGGGFSMHVAAWPMLAEHPGPRYQTGLFSTWMFPAPVEPEPDDWFYTDIEGGLGWWRDTRFPTTTPKFIMGGVAHNFRAWANGPGAGKGRDWDEPAGKYGVAQLSPWILWPPDGLNLAQGTSGELLGYGYLPLPLTEAKATTAGQDVPTGDRSWTLFLDAANFKGPVAFFTPFFFSEVTVERTDLAGRFLDSQPSESGRPISMETQHIPAATALGDDGVLYARIADTRFPVDARGDAVMVHRHTSYTDAALWNDVEAWFEGGEAPSGRITPEHGHVHRIRDGGNWGWSLPTGERRTNEDGRDEDVRAQIAREVFAESVALDEHTFGYRFGAAPEGLLERVEGKSGRRSGQGLVRVPEYYRLDTTNERKSWVPVPAGEVPVRERLATARFVEPRPAPEPYVTPTDGCWAEPGPVAGPFTAELGDGSVVTYSWYRFADQPALQNADLTAGEREELQRRVELIHRAWTRDRQYLPPATTGTLASIDLALIVEPPEGFEAGYVPIVTRQAAR
jgi:hypothetical protein